MNKTIASLTLGCKVNSYDTEAMLELFTNEGFTVVPFEEFADVYLVNTCTVTNLGDKKSRQMLRRAKSQNENAIVVAAGCYAQVSPKKVSEIPEVDLVVGTKDRSKIVEAVLSFEKEKGKNSRNLVTDIMSERVFEPLRINDFKNRTRAYLKIQEGCNQFCSYCIIPYARGPIRSRNPEDVLGEVKRLAANGFKEVVLAGIHVASYGKDLKNTSLSEIISLVHEINGIERIRFSSIEPRVITEDFVKNILSLPKICDHFHLSLQSGCDKTLKAMNRKYTLDEFENAVNLLRRNLLNVGITTDIIVGFPNEDENDFEESLTFAKKMRFSKMHVFPYSPKEGTPAATFENQVSSSIKAERCKKMIALGQKMEREFLEKFVGQELPVLFEVEQDGFSVGHTTNYLSVKLKTNELLTNKIQPVRIISTEKDVLLAENDKF